MRRSCGNRHCPGCQHEKTQRWLAKQTDRLLPVHHFLVTFTVPDKVWPVLRARQKAGYDALFAAARDTIGHRAEMSRYLKGCQLGFFGVLRAPIADRRIGRWGRDRILYHPHVHFVVPSGGVNADGSHWKSTPQNFLFPHGATVNTVCFQRHREGIRWRFALGACSSHLDAGQDTCNTAQALMNSLLNVLNQVQPHWKRATIRHKPATRFSGMPTPEAFPIGSSGATGLLEQRP